MVERGDWAPAVLLLREAVRHVPTDWSWRVQLAGLLALAQRWDEALAALEAPPARRRPAEAACRHASLLAQAGRLAAARAHLDALWPPGTPQGDLWRPAIPSAKTLEALASALWHTGRHRDLLELDGSLEGGTSLRGRHPTRLLARAWGLLLADRTREARSLLGPMHSYRVAQAGDVPVRFAHRGLRWIADLAHGGVRQALAVLPRPEPPSEVPGTVEEAFADCGPLAGWSALVVFGAGRDHEPRVAAAAGFVCGARAGGAWRDLLPRLNPENSPGRWAAARCEAAELLTRDAAEASVEASRRAEAACAALRARRPDTPSPAEAAATDLAMEAMLRRLEAEHPRTAARLRAAYAAEVVLRPRPPGGGRPQRSSVGSPQTAPPSPPTHADLRVQLLGHPCWRVLRVPLADSLDELHSLIQEAFAWGNDHPYAFLLGKGPRDLTRIYGGPMTEDEGALDLCLADLALTPGRRFWYVFDFGDWHQFSLTVLALGVHPGDDRTVVLERHGNAPEQYPAWDRHGGAEPDGGT